MLELPQLFELCDPTAAGVGGDHTWCFEVIIKQMYAAIHERRHLWLLNIVASHMSR